jgi:TPR repeat protein
MLQLAQILADGDHPDYEKARLWFQRAADKGSTSAMVRLGVMYQWGIGVPEDSDRAVYWYHRGVEGHDALAMYNLGGMYLDGRQMPLDVRKARDLFRAAADLGNLNAKARLAALENLAK